MSPEEKEEGERQQQAVKDNLKIQIQNMTLIKIDWNDLECGENAPISITITGHLND